MLIVLSLIESIECAGIDPHATNTSYTRDWLTLN